MVGGPFREWSRTLDFVLTAEALGFDAYWANDHPIRSMDCWSTLAALAATTSTIRLMALVNCVYYRSPLLAARLAADVDRLSEGRLTFGVGIGDDRDEFAQMNIPYPPTSVRQRALEEFVTIVRGLWKGERFSFDGQHFATTDAVLSPGPVQAPHVPVLLAGGGERVTLRQVAQFGDVCNFGAHQWTGGAFDVAAVRRKLAALDEHCRTLGRPSETILRSHYTPLIMLADTPAAVRAKASSARISPRETIMPLFATPDQAVEHFGTLVAGGMQYFLAVIQGDDRETMRLLADIVIPAVNARR